MALAHREYNRKWMKANRAANHERVLGYERAYRARLDPEVLARRKFAYSLWALYRLRPVEFDNMVIQQKGVCAICLKGDKRLQVDHCHTTGKTRGLLCPTCNKGMIAVDKSELFCTRAKEYKVVAR